MRPLTESGLLVAISVLLGLLAVFLPVAGMVAALLWALPFLVLVVRHGLRQGILALVVSAVVMTLFLGPWTAVRIALSFGPVGIALGYGFSRGWDPAWIFLCGLATAMVSNLLAFALLFAVTGINPVAMERDIMQQSLDASMATYQAAGVDTASLEESKQEFEKVLGFMEVLAPILLFILGLIYAGVNYYVGSCLLRRFGYEVATVPPFRSWRLPGFFLYLFAFALIGLYWGKSRSIDHLYTASFNLTVLAMIAGLVEGCSLLGYVMNRLALGKVWRVLVYFFFCLNGILAQLLAVAGLFDMVFDYRKRYEEREKEQD